MTKGTGKSFALLELAAFTGVDLPAINRTIWAERAIDYAYSVLTTYSETPSDDLHTLCSEYVRVREQVAALKEILRENGVPLPEWWPAES